jgi:FkbM family methyltransferase
LTSEPRNLKTQIYSNFRQRNEEAEAWSEDRVLKSLVPTDAPFILDVGAYTGTSAIRFRELFPKSRIRCFEPNPEAYAELQRTRSRLGGDMEIFELAVGDIDGDVTFNVQGINPGLSGLAKRNLDSNDSIALTENRDSAIQHLNLQELAVKCTRLDSIGSLKPENIDLLKIDVQSCESQVLAGAQDVLKRTAVVLVEVSFYDLYVNRSSFLSVEQFTAPAGLRLWAITTHSRNPMNGRTDWVNVIYSRN